MIEVNETSRTIRFRNGTCKTLYGVVGLTRDDTTIGLHIKDGRLFIVNPREVLYHEIIPAGKTTK